MLLFVNFIVHIAYVAVVANFKNCQFSSSQPWIVGPQAPLITVKIKPVNIDLVLQLLQGPCPGSLQSLSAVQVLPQLPADPLSGHPVRESSLKGFARTRLLVRERRRKSWRKVMLPRRVSWDWGEEQTTLFYMLTQLGVISLLLCLYHDIWGMLYPN